MLNFNFLSLYENVTIAIVIAMEIGNFYNILYQSIKL